ncbi:MAG: hypothetical protein R3194_14200, partial [Limnobacter sp.]|nr:hypothetical protein [Limnobacter sp.]
MENRFAPRFERAPHKYRREGTEFIDGYSIPEFLELSQSIGAKPWVVMPTTYSPTQAERFGGLMAKALQKAGVTRWVLEFGNENWNTVFGAAGFQKLAHHQQAFSKAKAAFTKGFAEANLPDVKPPLWLANAQFVNPYSQAATLSAFKGLDGVAVASYSAFSLSETASTPASLFDSEHASRWARWERLAKPAKVGLWSAEVNLHALSGSLATSKRVAMLSSPDAETAVIDNVVTGWISGAPVQLLYSLAAFDTHDVNDGLVPLFGVLRDLTGTLQLRPAGRAMQRLNQWLGHESREVAVLPSESQVLAVAQRPVGASGCNSTSVVLVNRSANPEIFTVPAKQNAGRILVHQDGV